MWETTVEPWKSRTANDQPPVILIYELVTSFHRILVAEPYGVLHKGPLEISS